MKLITFDFTVLCIFQLLITPSAHADPVQLNFPHSLEESMYCQDGVNGTSCIDTDSNLLGLNPDNAILTTGIQPVAKIKQDIFFPFVKMTELSVEAKCVSGGGSTAAIGTAGGFCLASDLNTSANDFAIFGVANELPVAGLQYLQVILKDGSTLVGSSGLVDVNAPIGSVCASAGGTTAASNGSKGFCLTADLSSDGPATFAVANDIPAVGLQFLQVKFAVNSQLGSSSAGVATCTSINGSTATSGIAGGSCIASDLISSTNVIANFATASELSVTGMQFLQMTFQDGATLDQTNSNILAGVECLSNGGSNAMTGEAGVSCLVSDLNTSIIAEDAGISMANDLPVTGMQLLQATFGSTGQPDESNGSGALVSQCASLEGSTANAGTSEEFCLTSDRNTSLLDFADFSMANALPISSLHFVQIPFQESEQTARTKSLLSKKSPMGVIIFDSVKKLRLDPPSIPVFKGIAGNNNRYFRISQKRSGIELKSGPSQQSRTRPLFWGSR